MTAEIAICNSNGIALAADSAVSMLNGDKIYNSANKLFSLSKHQTVAIMVYNSANVLSVPWEVVIKQYRQTLGTKSFPKLEDYCEDFWKFISSNKEWFPDEEVNNAIARKCHSIIRHLSDSFISELDSEGISADDPNFETAAKRIISDQIQKTLAELESIEFAVEFDEQDITQAIENYSTIFQQVRVANFERLNSYVTKKDKSNLERLCAISLTKNHFTEYSGVVIAGYGENEILPKIASYNVGIFANNKLRYSFNEQLSNIKHKTFCPAIYPFAQDDVVRSFINGIDPELDKYIHTLIGSLQNLASLLPDHALDEDIEKAKEIIGYRINEIASTVREEYTKTKEELGTQPLLQMLALLPKDELAEMAESLINLTAFKRRMSTSKESVGGPIDVAILSKGDGLIWIKRKHYFDPQLNQHFFHNYFLESGNAK